jgi:hypothetical protein
MYLIHSLSIEKAMDFASSVYVVLILQEGKAMMVLRSLSSLRLGWAGA